MDHPYPGKLDILSGIEDPLPVSSNMRFGYGDGDESLRVLETVPTKVLTVYHAPWYIVEGPRDIDSDATIRDLRKMVDILKRTSGDTLEEIIWTISRTDIIQSQEIGMVCEMISDFPHLTSVYIVHPQSAVPIKVLQAIKDTRGRITCIKVDGAYDLDVLNVFKDLVTDREAWLPKKPHDNESIANAKQGLYDDTAIGEGMSVLISDREKVVKFVEVQGERYQVRGKGLVAMATLSLARVRGIYDWNDVVKA